jgi:cell division protein FtsW (lipid II flippase)
MQQSALRQLTGQDFSLVNPAWLCIISGLLLSLLGIYAIDLGQNPEPPAIGLVNFTGLVAKQSVFLCVGILAASAVCVPHFRWIRLVTWPLLLAVLGLLVFLLIPFVPTSIVRPRNGARAWIELGAFDFQPSELAKIAVVLALAEYLRYRQNHRTWAGLVPPGIIAGIPLLLIMKQPDLGMALTFGPALFAMLLVAGARMKHLTLVLLCAMLLAPAAYPLLRPHQKARIEGLIRMIQDPTQGAEDINFQAIRSQTLAGAGGITGVSDAKTRSLHRYNALPERHNDMVISVVLTRFGLLGGVGLFVLYFIWFTGAYLSAAIAKDGFGQLLIVGCSAIIFAQAFINASMALGLLPIIGITLPFVSYGGTSMVATWLITGLIFSVAMRRSSRLARPNFEFDEDPYDPVRVHVSRRIAPVMGRRG